MPTRIFGSIKGAGVQVIERTPAKPIEQGPYGTTAFAAIYRSGPVGEAVPLPSGVTQFRRIYGGLTQDSEAPLMAEHFYSKGRGAGTLIALRVTDGSEVKARLPVYDRNVSRSARMVVPSSKVAAQLALLEAHNGGRWGGRRDDLMVIVADMAVNITGVSTLATGLSMLTDKWKGATITFPGVDASFEGEVASNTSAGVITITGVWSQTILDSVAVNSKCLIRLANTHELTGEPEQLAVEIGDSDENTATKFSLYVHRDGISVKSWTDLGLDDAGDSWWYDAINDDTDNWEIDPTDLFVGDPLDALKKPANFAEIPALDGVGTNTVALQVYRWAQAGTGDPFPLLAWTGSTTERPCTILCDFSAALAFDVTVTMEDGSTISIPGQAVNAIVAGRGMFPSFTVLAGDVAADATTTLTIYVRPLPANLKDKGGYLYIAAAASEGDVRERYRITGNTHDTITVSPSVDLSSKLTAPTAPTAIAPTAEPFALAGGETLIYSYDGKADVTLTNTLIAGAATAVQLAAELNDLEALAHPVVARVLFEATAAGKVQVTSLRTGGLLSTLSIDQTGTLNPIIGLSAVADTDLAGTDGKVCRVQWRQEFGGGYDGIAGIANADYIDALDPVTSPLNELLVQNLGLITVACPGVAAYAVQAAAMEWAYATNNVAIVEIADTVLTEAGAISAHEASLAIGAAQDYSACHFPSYGKIASPYGTGLYTTPLTGAICGYLARHAVDNSGYHLAPAGLDASLSPLFVDLTTGDTVLNNEVLNGYGLIEVRKVGASIYLWGDRIVGNGWRPFWHKRRALSHIGRVLLTNTSSLVWSPINTRTFATAKRVIRELFRPWYLAGWFDDSAGAGFDDQVEIKVDDTNNPVSERNLGNMHIDIATDIVNTAERVIFSLGPKGVSESS